MAENTYHYNPRAYREVLGDETVTLTIGPSHKRFIIHKRLICEKSDFFHKAFMGGFMEGEEGKMDMPEDSEGAISLFLGWLYRGTLRIGHRQSALNNLLDLYFFGEKICLPRLIDDAMDEIRLIYNEFQLSMTGETIQKVYLRTDQSSKLRMFCIDLIAFQYSNDQNNTHGSLPSNQISALNDNHLETIWDLGAKDRDIYLDYFRCIQRAITLNSDKDGTTKKDSEFKFVLKDPRTQIWTNSCSYEFCHYHCHTTENPCYHAKMVADQFMSPIRKRKWVDDTV